jgi:hypothetical protein
MGLVAWFEKQRNADLFLSVISVGEIERGIARQRLTNPGFSMALATWLDKLLTFAMGQAIAVRADYSSGEVRRLAQPASGAGAAIAGDRGGARRVDTGRGGAGWRDGSPDPAGLGDPVQRAGGADQHSFAGRAGQTQRRAQVLSRPYRRRGPNADRRPRSKAEIGKAAEGSRSAVYQDDGSSLASGGPHDRGNALYTSRSKISAP